MREFLDKGGHLQLESLVEVIAGSSKDNTGLVTDLVERLEQSIADFETQYNLEDFDPYADLEWVDQVDEQQQLWRPISEKLASGPAPDSEVDKLKRSIIAESRTSDQNVVIREFSGFQRSVSYLQTELTAALRESQKLDGHLKSRAMSALYKAYQIAVQIGFLFAPIIATRRFFVWSNVAFYNQMDWPGYAEADLDDKAGMVAGSIPRALVIRASDEMGSRKLGALISHMAQDVSGGDFASYLTFALVLRSKPEGWDRIARQILDSTDRTSLYLRYMLSFALRQFNQEVNTSAERTALKRIVANIQAKRELLRANPNTKAIDKVLRRLEVQNYFERTRNAAVNKTGRSLAHLEQQAEQLVENGAIDVLADEATLDSPGNALLGGVNAKGHSA
ncbi:MAG: hypothetical protein EOO38_05845 [Cytophagaceae bacterium]|nr:MAG: hypothetical protein EOO38_05845 [Cytophagaceae bacterium]